MSDSIEEIILKAPITMVLSIFKKEITDEQDIGLLWPKG